MAAVAAQISKTTLEVIFKCFQDGRRIKATLLNIHLAAYVCFTHLVPRTMAHGPELRLQLRPTNPGSEPRRHKAIGRPPNHEGGAWRRRAAISLETNISGKAGLAAC